MELLFIIVIFVVVGLGCLLFKIIKWAIKPFMSLSQKDSYEATKECGEEIVIGEEELPEKPEEPLKVEIKNSQLDTSRIIEYKGEEVKKFEFRPEKWEQFIGQTEGKNRAKTIIKKAKRGIRCHFLVDGIKGHGKTTFVELLAKSLNAKLIERVGKQIDEDSLLEVINEINTSTEKYVVFFLDEIETTDWKVIKILNPIIEQFKISGKKIKPFIFVGATINKHVLIKNNPDTLDRIPAHIKFARYTAEDIEKIIRQYKEQLYPDEKVSDKVFKTIATNAKFNPRTAIFALLEDFIVEQDIGKVLKNAKIIKNGLNEIDIEILRVLSQSTRAMGANALAMRVKLSQKEYITEFEPFLVEYGYINRVPSRVITPKGKQLLEELKNG